MRSSERSWTLHVMTLRLRLVDESSHDARSRLSSSADMDASRKASLSRRVRLERLSVIMLYPMSKRVMKAVFLYDHVETTIFTFRGGLDICYVETTSWTDEIVLGWCKQEINMFVIVLLSSQSLRELNQRKKKNTIQQCIWAQVSSRVTYVT